ncbi:hypothetical protein CLV49_2147 [Labedella gwakjiensis]|uniref:Lipoprotein LprG n=1 Tax=Labedella gwakjiensis TaxID=390269 RepID=A0A2P8GX39_9MICO|nr:hypothetical protein [Labedella gwakjiensis]PSL38522.1 hypothetical protein CLV49_2147 [Labedella gwakjiensis]RUQ86966.1 hypothetical protein ELQ93_08480 [Labedella gwakjiensis]
MSKRPAFVAAVVAAAIALSGCTADVEPVPTTTPTNVDLSQVDITDVDRNGIEYLSGGDVVEAVLAAMGDAGPVAMTGSFQERPDEDGGGTTRRLDVVFEGTDTRFRANITAADVSLRAVVVDGRAYVTGDAGFAALLGVPEADGGIVCLASDDRRITAWAPALSPAGLVESILGDSDSVTLDPAVEPDAAAESLEFIVGAGGSPIGSLTVATTGPAVPLQLVAADPRGDIDVAFDWSADPQIAAPTDIAVSCP